MGLFASLTQRRFWMQVGAVLGGMLGMLGMLGTAASVHQSMVHHGS
ncbi:hypothetical protein DSBG_3054 [Desulfosporosinus sp. BG]|nr:hypothetical protein DSBG_3054 [Desulfosporosinus sp. BG]